ncbi:MAG: GtrA family protein [Oscillospiraceae bacterium]|jgi:putative flippase GtrA|nr:GtrA family protein [Oscillospiraceae bacterium]
MQEAAVPAPVRLTAKQNALQTVKYFLFAASAGAIQTGSFALLTELTPLESYWPCYLISLVLSVIWNFTFNRKFTFKSVANIPKAMLKVIGYYCVFTPIATLGGDALTKGHGEASAVGYVVFIGTLLLNGVTEFLFYRFVVYRNSMNTNASGQREEALKRAAQTAAQEEGI